MGSETKQRNYVTERYDDKRLLSFFFYSVNITVNAETLRDSH